VRAPIAVGLLAAALLAPTADATQVQRARYLMGTICTVVADAPESRRAVTPADGTAVEDSARAVVAGASDTTRAAAAVVRALDEIDRLDRVMSSWRVDSELSRLNASGGMWVPCSKDLYAVLDSSLAFAEMTRGAFDPTIEPLNRAWDTRGKGKLPNAFTAERALMMVGYQKMSLDPGTQRAFLSFTGMGVDLGGIGKGYALDRAARSMRDAGVSRALLNFGGETLALGEKWEVAVADPSERLKPVVRLVVSDAAVSTSSQSERGIVIKKKRYGHIFDPRTGQPVESQASVSVVARSATRADALSTALLVMGRDAAETFAAKHPEIGVLWIEPVDGTMQIWKWNLSNLAAETDAAVEWMN